jgi:hypothetical protein
MSTKVFKNIHFTTRDYEVTNVVACIAESAPNENWVECDAAILAKLTKLWIQNNVQYYGWL